jgi:hypothetical protein
MHACGPIAQAKIFVIATGRVDPCPHISTDSYDVFTVVHITDELAPKPRAKGYKGRWSRRCRCARAIARKA